MEKVINCFKKRPDAVTRLICFPWAGGGSIHYARWGSVLSNSIEGKHTLKMWEMFSFWTFKMQKAAVLYSCMASKIVLSLTVINRPSFSVFAVKLPGREGRAKEPFFQNMQQIVDEVVGVLLPELQEKPFALFGHR